MTPLNRAGLAGLAALAVLAGVLPARAQESAESLVRKAMADAGVYNGYSVKSMSRGVWDFDAGQIWNGLKVSSSFATADDASGWSLVYVVQNFTDQPYCIRPHYRGLPSGQKYYVQSVNQIVDPGKSLAIIGIADMGSVNWNARVTIAYWRPNYQAGNGSYCRSTAPEGLDDWIAGPVESDFPGSRR
ncbi:MAG: hypothetical protein Q8L66_14150 [Caulobacter sp.]|nr:hypothetical protein [Caulobacter sp.]